MADFKPTAAQQAVIDHQNGALLVAAAAGSGKTKVLVDRMLQRVSDPVNPKNVDDFLIITYTKAAASELRGKIAKALGERMAQDPGNLHLQRQVSRLYTAQISTVHAFCKTILQTYAHQLGIAGDFRVADELEAAQLAGQALEQTMEEALQTIGDHPEIRSFMEMLGIGRNDRKAQEAVLAMYKTAICHANPKHWLDECARLAQDTDKEPLETIWGQEMLSHFQRELEKICNALKRAKQITLEAGPTLEKLLPVLNQELEQAQKLQECQTWEAIHSQAVSIGFVRWPTIRKCEDEMAKETTKTLRNDSKANLTKLILPFQMPLEMVIADQKATADALLGLFELTKSFMSLFAKAKSDRHLLDFSDLEQYSLRLLMQPGTKLPTAAAREISQQFCEIMVDEYQDTNEVQDLIFSMVSQNGENRFLVGDVKQSIYRFRMADPTIFLRKYKPEEDSEEITRILLSENFRSAPEILDAANAVFYATMSEAVGDLDYTEAEALKAGGEKSLRGEPLVELHCLETDVEDEEAEKKEELEARFIADRITQLMWDEKRPAKDFAILLRSLSGSAQIYVEALREMGIPAQTGTGSNILDTQELEIVIAILQTLDNPHQDIPLLAALTSPIFQVSYDDVAKWAKRDGGVDLYDALQKSDCPAIQSSLAALAQLRNAARFMDLDRLLQTMDNRLGLRKIFGAMDEGTERLRNLDSFFALAAAFDKRKTLHQFTAYLEGLKKSVGFGSAAAGDGVQIISIHRSKGLEYPVVFLAGLSKSFNNQDLYAPILMHPQLGAACNRVNAKERISYPTVAKTAIANRIRRENISEEMRVLYVAMTRPKERLIMTYCRNRLAKHLEKLRDELQVGSTREAAKSAQSMGDWVLLTALTRAESHTLPDSATSVEKKISPIPWHIAYYDSYQSGLGISAPEENTQEDEKLPDLEPIYSQLRFVYPYEQATKLPTKVTATQLKGRSLDDEAAQDAQALPVEVHLPFNKPHFSTDQRALTATEKGTATHLAMQFIRYEVCGNLEGVQTELNRLLEQRYLTQQQFEAVAPEKLLAFFQSAVGQRVRQSQQVLREYKFSLLADGSLLSQAAAGEQLLLQGVTDCCIFEPDGITVLDFKTDWVLPGGEIAKAESYRGQLDTYGYALERIFKQPVKERILYFFATDTAITI